MKTFLEWRNTMEWLRFSIAALLILGGIFTAISAAIGVFKFKECLTRMHAAAMGDTLALALVLAGLVLLFGISFTSLKLVLVIVFLWLASPVSSHLIAQMTYERKKREHDNI